MSLSYDLIIKVFTEDVFLVMLGTSSFPDGHEVYGKTTEKLVLSWEQVRTRDDLKYDLKMISINITVFKHFTSFV